MDKFGIRKTLFDMLNGGGNIQGIPTPILYLKKGWRPRTHRDAGNQSAVLQSVNYFLTIFPNGPQVDAATQSAVLQTVNYFNTLISVGPLTDEGTQAAILNATNYFLAIVSSPLLNEDLGTQDAILQTLNYFLAIVSTTPPHQAGIQNAILQSVVYA